MNRLACTSGSTGGAADVVVTGIVGASAEAVTGDAHKVRLRFEVVSDHRHHECLFATQHMTASHSLALVFAKRVQFKVVKCKVSSSVQFKSFSNLKFSNSGSTQSVEQRSIQKFFEFNIFKFGFNSQVSNAEQVYNKNAKLHITRLALWDAFPGSIIASPSQLPRAVVTSLRPRQKASLRYLGQTHTSKQNST